MERISGENCLLWQKARLTCMKEAFYNKMSSSARKIFVSSSGKSLSRYGAQGIMVSVLKLSVRRWSSWKGAAWWSCFYWIFPTPETGNVLFPVSSYFFIWTTTWSLPFFFQFVPRRMKTIVHSDLLWTVFILVIFADFVFYEGLG